MFTVCPKCALTLVVTAQDLRVAQGYVRCGRCSNVFNALARLSEDRNAAAAAATPQTSPPAPKTAADAPSRPPQATGSFMYTRPPAPTPPGPPASQPPPPSPFDNDDDESIPEHALEFNPAAADVSQVFVEPPPNPEWTAATGTFKSIILKSGEATHSAEIELDPDFLSSTAAMRKLKIGLSEADTSTGQAREEGNITGNTVGRAADVQPPSRATPQPQGRTPSPSDQPPAAGQTSQAPAARAGLVPKPPADPQPLSETQSQPRPRPPAAETRSQPQLRPSPADAQSRPRSRPSSADTQSQPQSRPQVRSSSEDTQSQPQAHSSSGDTQSQPQAPPPSEDTQPQVPSSSAETQSEPQLRSSPADAPSQPHPRSSPADTQSSARISFTEGQSRKTVRAFGLDSVEPPPEQLAALARSRIAPTAVESQPPPPRSLRMLTISPTLWSAGAGALVILLLVQIVNHYRNDLAATPTFNKPITALYSALGVRLTPRWDLRVYDVRQLGASVDAQSAGQIMVRASVKNGGRQAQPMPLLRVTLQDRFGNRIAARDVAPGNYLPHAIPAASFLSAGQRVDAEMAFVDPGSNAVGFEIDACLPAPAGGIACANDPVSP